MKFKVGDKVIVTAGKDKGLKSEVVAVMPDEDKVVVKGANLYTKHVKPIPMMNRPGERVTKERPLWTGKVAILNDKDEVDRIGFKINQDGSKVRVYKKTGKVIADGSTKTTKVKKKEVKEKDETKKKKTTKKKTNKKKKS